MHDGEWTDCWKCKTTYFLPRALYTAAKASPDINFCCPYGHSAHFPDGPTQADKMRRRAERAEQESARLRDQRDAAERSVAAQKGNVTKLKKRAAAGVCPCCNRTFQNLHRHMKGQHPDFAEKPEVKKS